MKLLELYSTDKKKVSIYAPYWFWEKNWKVAYFENEKMTNYLNDVCYRWNSKKIVYTQDKKFAVEIFMGILKKLHKEFGNCKKK